MERNLFGVGKNDPRLRQGAIENGADRLGTRNLALCERRPGIYRQKHRRSSGSESR